MAQISSRLTSTGNLLLNGTFDEITYNSTSPTIINLLTYTQQFTNSAWSNYQQYANSLVITDAATTAPDNTLTASKFASNNATATYYSFYRGNSILANTDYVFSTYLKAGELTQAYLTVYTTGYNNDVLYNLSTGVITATYVRDPAVTMSGGIVSVGNGWYRCYYT